MPPITKTPIGTNPQNSNASSDRLNSEMELVCREANDYLLCKVGDLLYAGTPTPGPGGEWSVPILLGNAWDGLLGRVGTLSVGADGSVKRLTPDERAEVQNRARLLASSSAS
jgi:hypothetical protein